MRFTASDNKLFDSKHLQKLFKEEKKLELSRELFVNASSEVEEVAGLGTALCVFGHPSTLCRSLTPRRGLEGLEEGVAQRPEDRA
jgi:hypothetical protein